MHNSVNEASGLRREFGLPTAIFLVIASMIGSGVLTSTGYMLERTPNLQLVLTLWAVGGALALCGALTMAEMATAFPEVGGDYVYVREAFGSRVGFMYGCSMVVIGFAAPTAMVAYTLGSLVWSYCQNFPLFTGVSANVFCLLFANVSILLFTFIHVLGHHESAAAQSVSTLFKIFVFIAFIALGLNSEAGHWSHFTDSTGPGFSFSACAANLILLMYSYTGWNGAVYIAGEIKNPSRNLTLSLICGTILVTVIYMGLNIIYGYAINPSEVSSLDKNDLLMFAETANRRLFSDGVAKLFSIMIGLGVIASLSSYIMTGPRIVYAMAKDNLLPGVLGTTCQRTQIPKAAIWCLCVISLVLLMSNSFKFLLDFAGYGLGVISLMIILPIFFLRRRPTYKPTFKVPFYPWLPIIFLGVSVCTLIVGGFETPFVVLTSLATIVVPYLIYPRVQQLLLRSGN